MAFGEVTTCNIVRKRGDTRDYTLTLKDSNEAVVTVSGYTVKLTVNTVKDPTLTSPVSGIQVFQATGVALSSPGTDGKLLIDMATFGARSPLTDNIQPGSYFYDIEVTDGNGRVSTVLEGKFTVKQDITK